MIVVDASVTLAWTFEDEQTATAFGLLEQVRQHGAVVPELWRLEVANILRIAMIKGRINATFREETFRDLDLMPFTFDTEGSTRAWSDIVWLSDRHDLTPYDATYLELAIRRQLPLATLDKALRRAALAEGVSVLP